MQPRLLTMASGTNKYVLSVCCLPNASEVQSSMKIPSASWPGGRETFFTHYVLMPSPQYSGRILVKGTYALSALPPRHATPQRPTAGAFSEAR